MADTLNLSSTRVLLAHGNKSTSSLYESILRGFGAQTIHTAQNAPELAANLSAGHIDLAIIDNTVGKAEVSEVISDVRRDRTGTARDTPILLSYCHSSYRNILGFRDSGANMIMSSPFTVDGIYDRISWIAYKPRPFVVSEEYCGPCRRVKSSIAAASQGRRHDDPGQLQSSNASEDLDEFSIV
jgi:CheY-like chemotaxis protein